jgi:hypothetical protein
MVERRGDDHDQLLPRRYHHYPLLLPPGVGFLIDRNL